MQVGSVFACQFSCVYIGRSMTPWVWVVCVLTVMESPMAHTTLMCLGESSLTGITEEMRL